MIAGRGRCRECVVGVAGPVDRRSANCEGDILTSYAVGEVCEVRFTNVLLYFSGLLSDNSL